MSNLNEKIDELLKNNNYYTPSNNKYNIAAPNKSLKISDNDKNIQDIINNAYEQTKNRLKIAQPDVTLKNLDNDENEEKIKNFDYKKIEVNPEEDDYTKLKNKHENLKNKYLLLDLEFKKILIDNLKYNRLYKNSLEKITQKLSGLREGSQNLQVLNEINKSIKDSHYNYLKTFVDLLTADIPNEDFRIQLFNHYIKALSEMNQQRN